MSGKISWVTHECLKYFARPGLSFPTRHSMQRGQCMRVQSVLFGTLKCNAFIMVPALRKGLFKKVGSVKTNKRVLIRNPLMYET